MILSPTKLTKNQKKETVKQMLEYSAPTWEFYLMLGLSAATISLGMWKNSTAVVIGGMLLAPMLYPIMSVAMGIVVGDLRLITRGGAVILGSILLSILIATGISFFFIDKTLTGEILARTVPDLAYFIIAMLSGVAMAYAMARPNLSATLPGVAINVALVPPLAAIVITLSAFQWNLMIHSLELFVLNLIGILFAALIVFALMNFHEMREMIERKLKAEEKIVEEEQKEKDKTDIKEIKKSVRQAENLLKKVANDNAKKKKGK